MTEAYMTKQNRAEQRDAEELSKYSKEIAERFLKDSKKCRSSFFPGWKNLILEINTELKKKEPDYTVTQIKAKFGVLCFYFDNVKDFTGALTTVGSITVKAQTICSTCGESKQRSGFSTCEKCRYQYPIAF